MLSGTEELFVFIPSQHESVYVVGGVFQTILIQHPDALGKAHTGQPVVLCYDHIPRFYPVDESKIHAVRSFVEHQRLRTFPLDLVGGVAQDDDRNAELLCNLQCQIDNRTAIKNVRSQILKTLYSICFCEDPLNETLWLKYADSHRGFVVTYDFHSADTYLCGKDGICKNCPTIQTPPNIYPVYYSNEKYDASRYAIAALLKVSMASSGVSIPQGLLRAADASMIWEIERISLLKKPCHVFDEEWRMIYSQWCVARPCIKLKPKSVIIGYRTPLYKERLIISAATVAGIKDVRKIQINRKDELEAVPIQIKN